MASSLYYEKYPQSARRFLVVFCALGFIATGAAATVSVPVAVVLLVMTVLFPVLGMRIATITSRDGITVRGVMSTKQIPWADIQDIRIEQNTAAHTANSAAPKQKVIVYDRYGKRTLLPNLNDETLRKGKSLRVELDHIRSTWEQLRGNDWVPLPEIRKIANKHG